MCTHSIIDNFHINSVFSCGNNVILKAVKFHVIGSYGKQNLTPVVFHIYALAKGLFHKFHAKRSCIIRMNWNYFKNLIFCSELMKSVLFQLFFPTELVDKAISIGGALLFSLFIIFDTHMLMHKLSPEEYIVATINLYLDIINLFLHLLKLLGERKN